MKYIWWYIKCCLGFGSVKDGSICWFSKKYYDVHDYSKTHGGDGQPSHFHLFKCSECGEEFVI